MRRQTKQVLSLPALQRPTYDNLRHRLRSHRV